MANPIYFIECSYGRRGKAFQETDRDLIDRAAALASIRNGEAIKVLEVTEPCEDFPRGQVLDITDELRAECGFPDTYRTPFTGEDLAQWQADRRRALMMAE